MIQKATPDFESQRSIELPLFLILIVVMFAFCQACRKPGAPSDFPTRDLNEVKAGCDPVTFIVSLNDDDDNENKRRDRKEARIDPKREDNLRQFIFNFPNAAKVYVAEPVLFSNGKTAVKSRIRAYKEDRKSRFIFNKEYSVPLTMYFEGVKPSTDPLDFGFEYQFKDKNENWICGADAKGTVIDVTSKLDIKKGRGAIFSKRNRMLIGVRGDASTKLSLQMGSYEWTYDGTAAISAPNQLDTDFQAGRTITPLLRLNQEQLRFRLTKAGLVIEAHLGVNITAPVYAQAYRGWINGRPKDSPRNPRRWFDANRGSFSLFNTRIDYRLLDQFRETIKYSAWGSRMVQDRENIGRVLTSPIPSVRTWIQNDLSWTENWRDKPNGQINDRLRALGITKDHLLAPRDPANPGRRRFHPDLRRQGGILMNMGTHRHEWEASVNGEIPTGMTRNVVTQNEFSVTVLDTRQAGGDVQIRLRSRYVIHTP
ncbi:MAG: hypothetical protein KAV87_22035 [Desulfobacteraceae bacterium]|nr:hypothetical protein [Desulfobacteraceae bacterium]